MKKVLLIVCALLSVYYVYTKNQSIKIPDTAIRFRVLANSNSPRDQQIKEKVRDKLQKELYSVLKGTKTIESAREKINKNMDSFKLVLDEEMKDMDYSYQIDYGMHEFASKTYKGITYDAGYYESLLVTLGSGNGDNWWCVLFPPLCVLEEEETTKDEVEYRSFIKDTIEKYFPF